MPLFINIADLPNPDDPQGRSYRECNAEKRHQIPIGALVEIASGARMFVVLRTRDCDQTPLYSLSAREEDVGRTADECGSWGPGLSPFHWDNGYAESSLKVIRAPADNPKPGFDPGDHEE